MKIVAVASADNPADLGAKILPVARLEQLRVQCGVVTPGQPARDHEARVAAVTVPSNKSTDALKLIMAAVVLLQGAGAMEIPDEADGECAIRETNVVVTTGHSSAAVFLTGMLVALSLVVLCRWALEHFKPGANNHRGADESYRDFVIKSKGQSTQAEEVDDGRPRKRDGHGTKRHVAKFGERYHHHGCSQVRRPDGTPRHGVRELRPCLSCCGERGRP